MHLETTSERQRWTVALVGHALGGQVQVAEMPPLAGRHHPVARVVDSTDEVEEGDVLLPAPHVATVTKRIPQRGNKRAQQLETSSGVRTQRVLPSGNDEGERQPGHVAHDRLYYWWQAQEAFQRGAVAVVTSLEELVPWPGRCVIHVADLRQAWWRWWHEDQASLPTRTLEASPLSSELRDFGAALPPGLKQPTCREERFLGRPSR